MTAERFPLRGALRAAALCVLAAVTTTWAGCFGCPCGSGPSKMLLVADPIDWPELESASSVVLTVLLVEDVELSSYADPDDEPMVFEGDLEFVPGFSGGWALPVDAQPFPFGGCDLYGDATFTLAIDGDSTVFEPIEMALYTGFGGVDTIELWNGWAVEIHWGGWVA